MKQVLSHDKVEALFRDRVHEPQRDVRDELLADVTRERTMVETRELEARAFELAAGVERPEAAREHLTGLQQSGELVQLEGGWWTTRELRELEQQALDTARERSSERVGVASTGAREAGIEAAAERHGHALTEEQAQALEMITGEGGVVVLVGEAGTGKGVVLDAAREAWERDGQRVIGTAIAGATAQRLGADAGIGETMTTDSLIRRVEHDRLKLDRNTVVVIDEAGMADTRRLARLIEITDRSDSKLVLAGDQAQLSPIGAGGLFAELKDNVPTAQLSEVHRAKHDWERDAWGQLRQGDAERALGEYQDRGRLHIEETRADAGQRMVNDWAATRAAHPDDRVVMLTDASNHELDQLNKQAQEKRLDAGELGAQTVDLPGRPYGLRFGDEVIFSAQHRVPGEARVENGTRGQVFAARERDSNVVIRTQEPKPRYVEVSTREFDGLRLAYAQHVYKAQGLTTDRSLVLTGGWQTDRETSYVALTRARERTDVYTSREDLGHAGIDTDAIGRLAERANQSHAQQASITRAEIDEPIRRPPRSRPLATACKPRSTTSQTPRPTAPATASATATRRRPAGSPKRSKTSAANKPNTHTNTTTTSATASSCSNRYVAGAPVAPLHRAVNPGYAGFPSLRSVTARLHSTNTINQVPARGRHLVYKGLWPGLLADDRREARSGVVTRHVVDVDHRGLDVGVAHIGLYVRERERLDGERAEGVPQVVEDERVLLAFGARRTRRPRVRRRSGAAARCRRAASRSRWRTPSRHRP